jgi:hypothetical protein
VGEGFCHKIYCYILEKKIALCVTKKINILTLVLSEKKILTETKNHYPLPFKLNGRSLGITHRSQKKQKKPKQKKEKISLFVV